MITNGKLSLKFGISNAFTRAREAGLFIGLCCHLNDKKYI
jgi:hypothetical protein